MVTTGGPGVAADGAGWRLVSSSSPRWASSSMSSRPRRRPRQRDSPKASASSAAIVCAVAVPSQHCHTSRPVELSRCTRRARGRTTSTRGRAGSDRRRARRVGDAGTAIAQVYESDPGVSASVSAAQDDAELPVHFADRQRWELDGFAVGSNVARIAPRPKTIAARTAWERAPRIGGQDRAARGCGVGQA